MGSGMNKVLPGLYIGSDRDAHDRVQLSRNKITHILAAHENSKPDFPDKVYFCLSVFDSPQQNLGCYFTLCNEFIHKGRCSGCVLVHCQMGVSRSATIVIAYLMAVTPYGCRDALNLLKAIRPFVNPNFGFQKQLITYELEQLALERVRIRSLCTGAPQINLAEFSRFSKCRTGETPQKRDQQPMDVDIYRRTLGAYGIPDRQTFLLPAKASAILFRQPLPSTSSQQSMLNQNVGRLSLKENPYSCESRTASATSTEKNATNENGRGQSMASMVVKPSNRSLKKDRVYVDEKALAAQFSGSLNISNNSLNRATNTAKKSDSSIKSLQNRKSADSRVKVTDIQDSNKKDAGGSGIPTGVQPAKVVASGENPDAKNTTPTVKSSRNLTSKELRRIGRVYLQSHVRTWSDMSNAGDDGNNDKGDANDEDANNGADVSPVTKNSPTSVGIVVDPVALRSNALSEWMALHSSQSKLEDFYVN